MVNITTGWIWVRALAVVHPVLHQQLLPAHQEARLQAHVHHLLHQAIAHHPHLLTAIPTLLARWYKTAVANTAVPLAAGVHKVVLMHRALVGHGLMHGLSCAAVNKPSSLD